MISLMTSKRNKVSKTLPPNYKVSEEIQSFQCIDKDWRPSQEELESDPKLKRIWEKHMQVRPER